MDLRDFNSNLESKRGPLSGSDPALNRATEEIVPVSYPFAGRIGGNLAFTLSRNDEHYDEKVQTTPDAVSSLTWKESFDLRAFRDVELWKQAILEGWATSMMVWTSGLLCYALVPLVPLFSTGPFFVCLIGSITSGITLTLFIYTTGPVSGGHMNPLITIATFFARLATFSRTILYVLAQTLGATIGAYFVRAAIGRPLGSNEVIPGCWINPTQISPGEAFVFEFMTCLTLLFLAFGIGLDPRQKTVYGPALAPFLIGVALAVCSFCGGVVRDGYTGAAMNPARCFGLMAAEGRWDFHWVHWVGAVGAGAVNGVFYWVIPPSEKRKML